MVNESRPRAEQLREALVAAAARTVEAHGFPGLKARELAAEVGCAVGSIYNVFPDFDALILAVKAQALDRWQRELIEELGPFVPAGPDAAAKRFEDLGRAYLDFAARNWPMWSSMFEHKGSRSSAMDEYMLRLDAILTNIEQPLGALLPEADGKTRRLLARTLFAAVHGVVSLGLDGRLGEIPLAELHDQVRRLLRATLKGLRS